MFMTPRSARAMADRPRRRRDRGVSGAPRHGWRSSLEDLRGAVATLQAHLVGSGGTVAIAKGVRASAAGECVLSPQVAGVLLERIFGPAASHAAGRRP